MLQLLISGIRNKTRSTTYRSYSYASQASDSALQYNLTLRQLLKRVGDWDAWCLVSQFHQNHINGDIVFQHLLLQTVRV